MRRTERLDAILERLSAGRSLHVADLGAELGVSGTTIRRDLEILEGQRLLDRTHGGAVPRGILYELPLRYKSSRNREAKLRIADEAQRRVGSNFVVGFTGGTTTTEVARALSKHSGLTIVTNALNIASELTVRDSLQVVVTGGQARGQSYELSGPLAEASLSEMNLDIAFIGLDGINFEAGLTTHNQIEARTNRALLLRARHVIVVADSSKVGRVAFARICGLSKVHELITDSDADEDQVEQLSSEGLLVTLV